MDSTGAGKVEGGKASQIDGGFARPGGGSSLPDAGTELVAKIGTASQGKSPEGGAPTGGAAGGFARPGGNQGI